MPIAYLCLFITMLTGIKIKLTPFVVLMMTMHRWFDCSAAVKVRMTVLLKKQFWLVLMALQDLGYKPIKSFREEWPVTIKWFRQHWLPVFEKSSKVRKSTTILLSHRFFAGIGGTVSRNAKED